MTLYATEFLVFVILFGLWIVCYVVQTIVSVIRLIMTTKFFARVSQLLPPRETIPPGVCQKEIPSTLLLALAKNLPDTDGD